MGIVDDAVEDGVGEGGFADDVVPLRQRQLEIASLIEDGTAEAPQSLEDQAEIHAAALVRARNRRG